MAKIKDLRSITPRTNGTRSVSSIKNIARHHSAGSSGSWTTFWPYWNKTLKWGTGGYHEIILRDGTVELCYDPHEITNGVGGQNSYIYNICLVGNGSFTAEQERVFDERARYWLERFNLSVSSVKGHKEFPGQSTNCPGINMNTVRARLSGQSSITLPPSVFNNKEGIGIMELMKLTTNEGKNAQLRVLRRFEQKDPALSEMWRNKVQNGTFTHNDGWEVFWVAVDRGYITGIAK